MSGASFRWGPRLRRWAAGCGFGEGAVVLAAGAWGAFSLFPAGVVLPTQFHDPNCSHGLLLPLLALGLIWRVRGRLAAAGEGARWPGAALLAAGAGLTAAGFWCQWVLRAGWRGNVFVQAVGWLAATAGAVWLLTGWGRFRILAPRLGVLAFGIPLPDAWMLTVSLALQRAVAICSTGLLRAFGVEVFREGDVLQFASLTLGIAGACGGIRSLMAFFAAAAACGALLELGGRRTLLLVALAPVAAVGANLARVLVTSLLALRWGRFWIEGAAHEAMGLAVVALGGALLFAAAKGLRPTGARAGGAAAPGGGGRRRGRPGPGRMAAALAAALILGGAAAAMGGVSLHYARMAREARIEPVARLPLQAFPRRIGGWKVSEDLRLAPDELDMLRPTDHLVRSYVDGEGNPVRLTALYWDPRPPRPGTAAPPPAPHSPDLCWRYEGWELIRTEWSAARERMPGVPVEVSLFGKPGRERLVLFWRSMDAGPLRRLAPSRLWRCLDVLVQSWSEVPEEWRSPIYQVRIDTEVDGEDRDRAMARALEFTRQVAVVLPQFGMERNPLSNRTPPD